MNELLALKNEIERVNEGVARAEQALTRHPDLPSVADTLRAIVQRRERLLTAAQADASSHLIPSHIFLCEKIL